MISAFKRNCRELLRDEDGATALEYGLIAAAIAGLIITVVYLLGGKLNNNFTRVAAHIN
jgi:pilus assembly protein Flp/PilA